MSVIEEFRHHPTAKEGDDYPVERDLLSMPILPWKAILATFFAVVLGFCIAHAVLLATKEKNKLIERTMALKESAFLASVMGLNVEVDADEVVRIPAGMFTMGRAEDDDEANDDSTPENELFLPDFYIGKYEVTNAQYQQFVEATGYIPPYHWKSQPTPPEGSANLPVTYVSWDQAKDYAAWRGGRLCTEPEWEKAARGTDRRVYPYGHEYVPTRANIDYLMERLTPGGSYPKGVSPYGVHDMMGNVYEWTDAHYAPYPGNRDDLGRYAAYQVDRAGNVTVDPNQESFYVVARGGCWKCDPWSSQVTTRNATRPDYAADFFGARVCWDAPGGGAAPAGTTVAADR